MYGIDTIRKLNEALVAPTAAKTTTTITVQCTDSAAAGSNSTLQTSTAALQKQNCKCGTETFLPIVEAPLVKEVSLEEWDVEILDSTLPVVVDFYAKWCGPCALVAPIISQLADEFKRVAKFTKIDVDKNNLEIVDKYNVRSIPTVIVFRAGRELARITGTQSKETLTNFVANYTPIEIR
jgi:thioredoxin